MKNIEIKVTVTDDDVVLDCNNLQMLTENDIIDSIKALVSLANTLNIIWEGDSANGNA